MKLVSQIKNLIDGVNSSIRRKYPGHSQRKKRWGKNGREMKGHGMQSDKVYYTFNKSIFHVLKENSYQCRILSISQ